jgi:3-oxoacyl-[acyl-carrier protein] reductase
MVKRELQQTYLPGLEEKVVVVTGGSKGIGREIVLMMSQLGSKVAIIDVDEVEGKHTAQKITEQGAEAVFLHGNVADENDIRHCMETIYVRMGGLHILVNNAGIMQKIPFEELSVQQWKKLIDVNLTGTFICSKIAAKYLIASGGGALIMISSGSVITGTGGSPHYTASKGGINSLVRYFSRELAPKGIRVNGVAPRTIDSEVLRCLYSEQELARLRREIPLRRLGTGKDVANVVAFLASDLAGFITGEIILMDGGRTYNS